MANKDLLLEIGTEELPAAFLPPALEGLADGIRGRLEAARLTHGEVTTYGTPRRLAVVVAGVAERQPDERRTVTGPPKRAAYDADGNPTKAAEGFARGQGVDVKDLEVVNTEKGEYVAAQIEDLGRDATEILPEVLAEVVSGLHFKKSMRWGDVGETFARPVHWLCALYGQKKVPFAFADVESGTRTYGHRFLDPEAIALRSPRTWVEKLEKAHVLADVERRRAEVRRVVETAITEANPTWQLREDEGLLDQVTHLVEWPVPVVGHFDESYLSLPPEVLVSEMREHQKYFSVEDTETGRLAPAFVAVSNTPVKDPELSCHGYERVLAARLADARYFFLTDRKRTLKSRTRDLERVVFQRQLGTIAEKVERIRGLSAWLAASLDLHEHQAHAVRAASLAKADLTTGMVGEFPDLQGIMGSYYARLDGEPAEVADAIAEHYLPRGAHDRLPEQHPGALVGIADRIDSLVGIFGIGKPPTGAADPFGLRRACLGIIHVAMARGYRFSLSQVVDQAIQLYGDKLTASPSTVRTGILDFFGGRLRHLLVDEHPADVVAAVLAAGFDDLVSTRERVEALAELKHLPEFGPLAVAFTRAANIVAKAPAIDAKEVDADLFEADAEAALWKAAMAVREKVERAYAEHDYQSAFQEMVALAGPVDRFFDDVLVMAEDARVRDNRLLLLGIIAGLFTRVADFSQIQTEAH